MKLTRREILLAVPLLMLSRFSFAKVDDRRVRSVLLKVTHTTQILKPMKKVRIWIPVPKSDHAQEVRGLKVVSEFPYRITEEKVWGNRSVFIETESIGETNIELRFTVLRRREEASEDSVGIRKLCLKPSEWEVWNKKIERFVDKVVGKEQDPTKVAKKLYDAIIDRTEYIEGVCGRGVSTLTFEKKLGRCDEFHALFRSTLMYRKIPVCWEEGIALPYPSELKKKDTFEADCLRAISWVRFYDGRRWIPVDLAEAKRRPHLRDFYFGRIPPNRVKLSRGRGIKLEPPQNEILNVFAYTHIEEEGIPAIYGHHYRNLFSYELLDMEVEG